jgi:AcrR family transcriptional regulator
MPIVQQLRPADVARIEKGRATKAALVDAARRLMIEHGADATSLQAVASAAGVTNGAIQAHFGTKDGLLLAVCKAVIADERSMQAAVVRVVMSSADPAGALVRHLWANYDSGRLDLIHEAERRAERDPEFGEALRELVRANPTPSGDFARAFGRRPSRAFVANLNAVLSAVAGFGYLRRLLPDEEAPAVLASIEAMARAVLGGKDTA